MITQLRSSDSVYIFAPNYSTSWAVIDKMYIENNNQKSDTQGFLRKIQIGDNRVRIEATFKGTKTDIESKLLPLLTYPLNCIVALDRTIITKSVTSMECVIDDYVIDQEFDNGQEYEVKITLIEVL